MAGEADSPPPYRLVLIEWADSIAAHDGWAPWEDGHDPEPVIARSIGRLVVDTDRHKVVIPHWYEAGGDDVQRAGCGRMTIPTVAVLRMVELVEGSA